MNSNQSNSNNTSLISNHLFENDRDEEEIQIPIRPVASGTPVRSDAPGTRFVAPENTGTGQSQASKSSVKSAPVKVSGRPLGPIVGATQAQRIRVVRETNGFDLFDRPSDDRSYRPSSNRSQKETEERDNMENDNNHKPSFLKKSASQPRSKKPPPEPAKGYKLRSRDTLSKPTDSAFSYEDDIEPPVAAKRSKSPATAARSSTQVDKRSSEETSRIRREQYALQSDSSEDDDSYEYEDAVDDMDEEQIVSDRPSEKEQEERDLFDDMDEEELHATLTRLTNDEDLNDRSEALAQRLARSENNNARMDHRYEVRQNMGRRSHSGSRQATRTQPTGRYDAPQRMQNHRRRRDRDPDDPDDSDESSDSDDDYNRRGRRRDDDDNARRNDLRRRPLRLQPQAFQQNHGRQLRDRFVVLSETACPPFTGSEDPQKWIDRFVRVAQRNNWNEEQMCNSAALAFAGAAADWFTAFEADHPWYNIWELFDQLERDYSDSDQRAVDTKRLHSEKQHSDENPRDFFYRLYGMAQRCRAHIPTDTFKYLYHNGLHKAIRNDITIKDHWSKKTLMKKAMRKWNDLGMTTKLEKEKPLIAPVEQNKMLPKRTFPKLQSAKKSDQPTDASKSEGYSVEVPLSDGRMRTYRFTKDGKPICARCNEVGHVARSHYENNNSVAAIPPVAPQDPDPMALNELKDQQ